MKITDKTFSKVIAIVLLIVLSFACCLLVACDNNAPDENNNNNNSGNNNENNNNNDNNVTVTYMDVTGYIRNVLFEPVQTDVYYNGEVKSQSDTDGNFELTVETEGYDALTGKIGLKGPSLTYFELDTDKTRLIIIELDEGMTVNDFYFFSGKVVDHSDGESAVAGSSLTIDGTAVATFESHGNFDVQFVHKDSVVTAVMDGYDCYDGYFHPWKGGSLADKLDGTELTRSVIVNGEKVTLKHIIGFTLRLSKQESN